MALLDGGVKFDDFCLKALVESIDLDGLGGLKQLTQTERKALETAIVALYRGDAEHAVLDKEIFYKISHPSNYQRSIMTLFLRGVAKIFNKNYIDAASLSDFIHTKNAEYHYRKNLETLEKVK